MDCILCRENGYVLVKGYQVDRQFKVSCPFCAKEKFEGEKTGAPDKKLGMTCTCCDGVGKVTIEAQDKTARTVSCYHCNGSGDEPVRDKPDVQLQV